MLESEIQGSSRLTQQIALPRMARISSLSATIMCCLSGDKPDRRFVTVSILPVVIVRSGRRYQVGIAGRFIICSPSFRQAGATE